MKVMEIEMAAKMDKMEREAEAEKKRLDAEMKILEAETSKQLAEAKKQEVEAKKEATKVELEAKKEEVEAKQKMESFEKSSEITKQTTVNNTFKDSGSINLGSGCYAVTLLGAGGGGGTSKFLSWGSNGGHGGNIVFEVDEGLSTYLKELAWLLSFCLVFRLLFTSWFD